jgi:hypothetical protein
MSEHTFPSGPWIGYFTYFKGTRKHLMDLVLEFKNGKMTGEGADGIGTFVISGDFSEESGECAWIKQYVGRHAVAYTGFREGKGIWGNWKLTGAKCGFHIWPLSEGGPVNYQKESEPEKKQLCQKADGFSVQNYFPFNKRHFLHPCLRVNCFYLSWKSLWSKGRVNGFSRRSPDIQNDLTSKSPLPAVLNSNTGKSIRAGPCVNLPLASKVDP